MKKRRSNQSDIQARRARRGNWRGRERLRKEQSPAPFGTGVWHLTAVTVDLDLGWIDTHEGKTSGVEVDEVLVVLLRDEEVLDAGKGKPQTDPCPGRPNIRLALVLVPTLRQRTRTQTERLCTTSIGRSRSHQRGPRTKTTPAGGGDRRRRGNLVRRNHTSPRHPLLHLGPSQLFTPSVYTFHTRSTCNTEGLTMYITLR